MSPERMERVMSNKNDITSSDSSISGPIDVEENLAQSDSKSLVAKFDPHSNKVLLEKTSMKLSSPQMYHL